ncbi:Aldehyde/histidinol dehydrogenase protein [Raphanus sativus]|nr:Aldehyde/histidinol dehydrogenase protein [Raphanus sativus]
MGNAPEIGDALLTSSQMRKITFKGSKELGKKLMPGAAPTVKKVSLKLSNVSSIIFDDADLDVAVKGESVNSLAQVESFVHDAISKGVKQTCLGREGSKYGRDEYP